MNSHKLLRSCAVLTCAAAIAVLAAPSAAAESATASHKDSTSTFTRTVSDTTVTPGEEITYTQKFDDTSRQYIYEWKNNVAACLKYVAGSATIQKGTESPSSLSTENVVHSAGVTHITSNDPSKYWTYTKEAPIVFTLKYQVTESCQPNQKLESGFWYKWSNGGFLSTGNREYTANRFAGGPAITVADTSKARSSFSSISVPDKVFVGESATLKATLAIDSAKDQPAPSIAGTTVRFVNDSETLCTANVAEDNTATCDWTPEKTGAANIQAIYDGTEDVVGSSSAVKATTVTTAPPNAPTNVKLEPANVNGQTQTVVSGKAEPGTTVEALGPGGTRCVAKTDDQGNFSCNLGYLPAVPGTISVTASRDNVRSDMAEVAVNNSTNIFDSFNSPGLPSWKFPESPSLPFPAVSPR